MNYTEANDLLTGRYKVRKKIANNTYLERRALPSRPIAVRLHDTDILTFYPDGSTVYDSGGWLTVTTKARMNEYGPLFIWSERGIWYATNAPPWSHRSNGKPAHAYADGMRLGPRGGITGAGPDPKATQRKRKRVQKYAKAYLAALIAGDVPEPDGGDCWYCSMFDRAGMKPNADHIESHITESYFVPSLVVNALSNGASQAMKAAVGATWGQCEPCGVFNLDGFIGDQVRKAITKHCYRALGLAV